MKRLVQDFLFWLLAPRRRAVAPTFNSEQWAGPLEVHLVERDVADIYDAELDEPELEMVMGKPLIIGGWSD